MFVTGGHHPPILKNNALFIDTATTPMGRSIGIKINKGAAQLQNNDFVFSYPVSLQKRVAVYTTDVSAATIVFNAFYSSSDQNIGVLINSGTDILGISDNSFSPFITPIAGEGDSESPRVVHSDLIVNPAFDDYPLNTPQKFFSDANNRGTTLTPTALILNGLSNRSNITSLQIPVNQYSEYDTSRTLTSVINDLIARAGYCQSCPYTINSTDAIGIPIVIVIGITTLILGGGWGGFIAGSHRPCLFCK